MKLTLERPVCFFDLEATGLDTANDRIVEICIVKLFPDGSQEIKTRRINPLIPIPEKVTKIHGISDEDVKDCEPFHKISKGLFEFIKDCDLGGFNSNFYDIPLLYNEFLRSGIEYDYSNVRFIDVGNIFRIQEPRTLTAAFKFYCEKDLEDAHSAEADVLATIDVFKSQLEKYDSIPLDIDKLHLFCNYDKPVLDVSGKFTTDENGEIVFNFGQKKGELASDNISYCEWMYWKANFSLDTRRILERILNITNA